MMMKTLSVSCPSQAMNQTRSQLTEQDADTERIKALAGHVRDRPLLPMDPRRPEAVFTDIDSGIALPVAHCAMVCANGHSCTWADP
eukprot:12372880-Karenia_brevis.AAC.1